MDEPKWNPDKTADIRGEGTVNTYAVIMAGGGGSRFWPLSRNSNPKQLLNLSGNGIMLNETIERVSLVVPKDSIFIVTNEAQKKQTEELVDQEIPRNHILVEPGARNTAACIGYAACRILKEYGDGIMCVFPADHFIKDTASFSRIIRRAVSAVRSSSEKKLLTIGIVPDFPATGYGYIHAASDTNDGIYKVNQFEEKPKLQKAIEYLDSGEYLWNSGMFVWRISAILEEFKRFLPKLYGSLERISDSLGTGKEGSVLRDEYAKLPGISIDYGILERSNHVWVVRGEFDWSDVGSWDALGAIYDVDDEGNIKKGNQINIETKGCVVYSENCLVATVGIEDIIIVETKDAVLVCKKDRAQDVKHVVEMLKSKGAHQYL